MSYLGPAVVKSLIKIHENIDAINIFAGSSVSPECKTTIAVLQAQYSIDETARISDHTILVEIYQKLVVSSVNTLISTAITICSPQAGLVLDVGIQPVKSKVQGVLRCRVRLDISQL